MQYATTAGKTRLGFAACMLAAAAVLVVLLLVRSVTVVLFCNVAAELESCNCLVELIIQLQVLRIV